MTDSEQLRPEDSANRVPQRKRRKIKDYLENDEQLRAAVASSTTKKRKTPEARAMAKGDEKALRRGVYNIILSKVPKDVREKLFKSICRDWDYCANRNEIAFLTSIIYTCVTLTVPLSMPICVWVFVVKQNILHELCGCPGSPPLKFRRGGGRFGL